MRYVIYQQGVDSSEIANSRETIIAYIKQQNPQAAWEIYEDEEKIPRMKPEKRMGLQKMMAYLQPGDMVVVSRLDRLSTDIIEMVDICLKIRDKAADFYSLAEGSLPNWMLGIYSNLAQKERNIISERTKLKVRSMQKERQRVGHIPYGYMLEKEIYRNRVNKHEPIYLIENPEEQQILDFIEECRKSGMTFKQIANLLNENGAPHRLGNGNKDGKWSLNSVSRVFKCRRNPEDICVQKYPASSFRALRPWPSHKSC